MSIELIPQPPPGVPAPPPGEEALRSKRQMKWIVAVGAVPMVFAMFLGYYLFQDWQNSHRHGRGQSMIQAVSNAKQIGLALFEFDNQYGKNPDVSTALAIKSKFGSKWALGDTTSNDLFQQLFVSGICESEEMFYAQTPWSKKPDNNRSTEADTLASRECGFAYIVGLSSKDDPQTPVCVSPLEPGKLTFDHEAFDGKAIILRSDQSVTALPIDKSGHVILNGMDLFDPRQPFWHGKAPTVKWPK